MQQSIERRLSALLGAEVTFEKFKLSLLGGSIEAGGVRVAAGAGAGAEPILTIGRIKAEISIARAMKKEIVVKSLAIERPRFTLVRRADGSLNLPGRAKAQAAPAAAAPQEAVEEEAPKSWALEAHKVLLIDGEIHYRSEVAGDEGYHVSAESILGEVRQAGGKGGAGA
ncbi:MAG TPA: hypothetical protein VIL86_01300, partial [Tepidisphaeraceae bacterium]